MKNAQKMIYKKYRSEVLATLFALFALSFLFFFVSATVHNTIAPGRESEGISATPTTILGQPSETENENGMKTYKSDFMKVEFEYQNKFELNSRGNEISLIEPNTKGNIQLTKYGTNFENVRDHLDDAIGKWKSKPTSRNDFVGADIKGQIVRGIDIEGEYTIYFFVKGYAIYQISSKYPALFPDLELIAKSFKILD